MKKYLAMTLLFAMSSVILAGTNKKDVIETGRSNVEKLKHKSKETLNEKSSYRSTLEIPESIREEVPKDMQYTIFWQLIVGLLKSEYVYEMSDREITEKAIAGILSSLDPHSCFMNEKSFAFLKDQTDGEFGGLGIEIMMDEGFVRIVSPIDDTPAYKAGLKSGDMIIYVDDECINGLSAEEVLTKLRGAPKTKVKLKIKRGDRTPFDVSITRDVIKIQSVKCEIINNIGYVRISTFDKNTSISLKRFLDGIKDKKLEGIVLDLRNNPGGLLDEAVAVSNMFLSGGDIVSIRGRTADNTMKYSADNADLTNGLPLVVLINSGTASAPEIVAGALRDNKRAIIVGVRSFGKGSVQKVIPLSEKSAIKMTIAKYFTPSGECIQANGITPDIEADYAEVKRYDTFLVREEFFPNALDADKRVKNKKKSDLDNEKAIDSLNKKRNEQDDKDVDEEITYRKMPLKERIERDYQLNKAFDVIKIIGGYERCLSAKKQKLIVRSEADNMKNKGIMK